MYIIKPKKNLWLFGAWFGNKYSDNTKYLFEYIIKNHQEINCIWITEDKTLLSNKQFIYRHSLKGMFYALRAEVFIVTHSTTADLYYFINDYARIVVQLWHGIPIKKIVHDDKLHNVIDSKFKRYYKEKYSLIIASSDSDKKNLTSAFKVEDNIVKVTGYPRNDIFTEQNINKKLKAYKILYAPTLRGGKGKSINLFDEYDFEIDNVIILLEKLDIYLDIKMHPVNKIDPAFKESIQHKRINFLESDIDINNILSEYSIIISDYSGIYIDYLLLNRPIIFAPFDYEKYLLEDRQLYYNYEDVSPGPKCMNWIEVLVWIEKFINNKDLYLKEREDTKNIFHSFEDCNNSKRVYDNILELL